MEHRLLGHSGFKVPVLGLGTGTFGGKGPLFEAWGDTGVAGARRLVDICLDAGVTLFDSADVYSAGASESILGEALQGRRHRAIISTKVGIRCGEDPNAVGASRSHLASAVERALARLRTDYIDLLQVHQFDALTSVEEMASTLDALVRSGKVRYVGVSNFSGWQVMNTLAVAERRGLAPVVAQQVYYSLVGRDYEWELMPLAQAHRLGAIVWSPLGWGRLTGRITRNNPAPPTRRLKETAAFAPPVEEERLYRVVDALLAVAGEVGRSVPQVAINWLLQRPTVSSVLIGARDEAQLRENIGATGWTLDARQMARLDAASHVSPPYPYYPYWNGQFTERAPPAVALPAA